MNLRHTFIAALVMAFGFMLVADVSAQDDRGGRGGKGGRGDRDTTVESRDTVKRDSTRRDKHPKRDFKVDRGAAHMVGFYLRNDSCREVFASQLSAEEAEQLANLIAAHDAITAQIGELRTQLREARAAGDTALYRSISAQLKEAFQQQARAFNALNEFLRAHKDLALRIMKDCGGRPGDRGERDKKRDENTDTRPDFHAVIAPNPVSTEKAAHTQVMLKLSAEATVTITVSDAAGVVVKTLDATTYAAGGHKIALDLSGLNPGPYHVRVQVGDKVQTLKLLIR